MSFRLLRADLMMEPAVVAISVAGAISVIAAMHFSIFVNGVVLRAIVGAILFVFVPFFMISAVVSLVLGTMHFSIFMDGLVPNTVMGTILFVFVRLFMISAIISLAAGIVMGVTVSVSKRARGGNTKHQSQGKNQGSDFARGFLCHGRIPPMDQNFVCHMTNIRYRGNMKGR